MDKKQVAIDVVTGVSVGSAPIWFQYMQLGVACVMMAAGLLLMYFRLSLAYKQWKEAREKKVADTTS